MSGSFRITHERTNVQKKPNPTTFHGLQGCCRATGNGLCALKKYFNGIRLIAFAIKWFRNQKTEIKEENENRVFCAQTT